MYYSLPHHNPFLPNPFSQYLSQYFILVEIIYITQLQ